MEAAASGRANSLLDATVYGKLFATGSVLSQANSEAILSYVAFIHPPPIKATATATAFLRGVLTGDAPRNREFNVPSEYRGLDEGRYNA